MQHGLNRARASENISDVPELSVRTTTLIGAEIWDKASLTAGVLSPKILVSFQFLINPEKINEIVDLDKTRGEDIDDSSGILKIGTTAHATAGIIWRSGKAA